MRFELLPLLDTMIDLYKKPRGFERFKEYLSLLTNEDASDIDLPIVVYNPMGKDHIIEKLEKLKLLDAEVIMKNSIEKINEEVNNEDNYSKAKSHFRVALVLADDAKGGWTNHFSTDYQSKFNLRALIKRKFCTPIFWTSEIFDESLIDLKTREYLYRTIYQTRHTRQSTLEEHILQESFVNKRIGRDSNTLSMKELASHRNYYQEHKLAVDHPTIFNFLYGEEAAIEFGYTPGYKCEEYLGFKIAHDLTEHQP